MNIYQNIKESLTVPAAAEFYGLQVNRQDMTCCPFHADRTPSMKLNDNYYYCFGCGESGDVIDLVAKLFDLKPAQAARKIAHDFSMEPGKPGQPRQEAPFEKTRAFREREDRCYQALRSYLDMMAEWKEKYQPHSADDPIDECYAEACLMSDNIQHLMDNLLFGSDGQRLLAVEMMLGSGFIDQVESYVALRRGMEERDGQNPTGVV